MLILESNNPNFSMILGKNPKNAQTKGVAIKHPSPTIGGDDGQSHYVGFFPKGNHQSYVIGNVGYGNKKNNYLN